jgi:hypothetical protein
MRLSCVSGICRLSQESRNACERAMNSLRHSARHATAILRQNKGKFSRFGEGRAELSFAFREAAQIDVVGATAGHLVVGPCLLHGSAAAIVMIDENFDAAVGTVAIDRLGAEIANHVCHLQV